MLRRSLTDRLRRSVAVRPVSCLESSSFVARTSNPRSPFRRVDARPFSGKPQQPNRAASSSPFSKQRQKLPPTGPAALEQLSRDLTELERFAKSHGLLQELHRPFWETIAPKATKQQDELLQQTKRVTQKLQLYLQKDLLQPKGKHHHEFSVVIEYLLQNYACCATANTNVWGMGRTLTNLLEEYHSSLSHQHCAYLVRIGAREGRWAEAASVFHTHVDPDQDGYSPVVQSTTNYATADPTVQGLYCVARATQLGQGMPVETIFDTVLKLTMVSPSDTDYYVLAAGIALGRAGEWEALRSYLQSSYNASQLGQSLAAAAMHACVLNDRHDEAWDIFQELNDGELAVASEWQWGGSEDQLHPACRDVAMRALGGATGDPAVLRDRAVELYQQALEINAKVSIEALCAVERACGLNGNWEDVTNLFLHVVDDKPPESWLVLGDDLRLTTEGAFYPREVLAAELGRFVDQSMRFCNETKRFGLGLCLLRLYEVALLSQVPRSGNASNGFSPIVQSIVPVVRSVRNGEDLVKTVAVALCGVNAPDKALDLLHACSLQTDKEYDLAKYISSLRESTDSSLFDRWGILHRDTHRLTAAITAIESAKDKLDEQDQMTLSFALAKTMRECTALSEPEMAITLGRWVQRRRLPIENGTGEISLFPLSEDQSPFQLPLTDNILAATLEAYTKIGNNDLAQKLIQSALGESRPPADWLLSYTEALEAWFALGHDDDAMAWFRAVAPTALSPGLFMVAAKHMKAAGNWQDVLDIYRHAQSTGCTTEALGLLVMDAMVSRSRISRNNKLLPQLRGIIAKTAERVGLSPSEWLELNYWHLKRNLGHSTARLLMGWNDVSTFRFDELELALESFEKRSTAGLTPKRNICFTLIRAAVEIPQFEIPPNKVGLRMIPRDQRGWQKILLALLQEVEATPLMWDPGFVNKAVVACFQVGLHENCAELVTDGLSRGLRLHKKALQCAASISTESGAEFSAADAKMLLVDPPEWSMNADS